MRGPWLEAQYGKEVVDLFKKTKDIFDPEHIFNPKQEAHTPLGIIHSHILGIIFRRII